jgi:predicted deacetylase
MPAPTLLIALHDVTPVHRARLEKAERLLAGLGVSHVAYLLVPDFHRAARADASTDFVAWCRARRRFDVQWFLHGYLHEDRGDAADGGHQPTMAERLASRFATGGEAECIRLGPEALRARLRAGTAVFESCLGTRPTGFVAPAWLFNRHLLPALKELDFEFTESHLRVFHIVTDRAFVTPVTTWATRTRLRRWGSLAVTAIARRVWRTRPVIRVALHPYDFDHPATVASMSRWLDAVRQERVVVRYDAGLFDPSVIHADPS